MIVFSNKPLITQEIQNASEQFDTYIKTVIDLKQLICVAGMDRHFEGERLLLEKGSSQHDLWGGGIDIETKEIDCNSFINIRPNDNNISNEIQNNELRNKFIELSKWFFGEII